MRALVGEDVSADAVAKVRFRSFHLIKKEVWHYMEAAPLPSLFCSCPVCNRIQQFSTTDFSSIHYSSPPPNKNVCSSIPKLKPDTGSPMLRHQPSDL
ncbi:hypothetical protein OUZ56_002060 [Daphnia magna]|uniref:Uncharacterized protein n=1 Tax=Daphnia magna TaxID=35525 RepID=A0ABR0A4Z5_9CRUS|nr:hypothetical protein OUZ56_002060 [Daphnia magna]